MTYPPLSWTFWRHFDLKYKKSKLDHTHHCKKGLKECVSVSVSPINVTGNQLRLSKLYAVGQLIGVLCRIFRRNSTRVNGCNSVYPNFNLNQSCQWNCYGIVQLQLFLCQWGSNITLDALNLIFYYRIYCPFCDTETFSSQFHSGD